MHSAQINKALAAELANTVGNAIDGVPIVDAVAALTHVLAWLACQSALSEDEAQACLREWCGLTRQAIGAAWPRVVAARRKRMS